LFCGSGEKEENNKFKQREKLLKNFRQKKNNQSQDDASLGEKRAVSPGFFKRNAPEPSLKTVESGKGSKTHVSRRDVLPG